MLEIWSTAVLNSATQLESEAYLKPPHLTEAVDAVF